MNTTSPQIGLPAGLSRAVAPEGAIMPKAYIEKVGEEEFRKKPIGSGPWKFVRNVPGDRIEFTAVTTPHWRGRPHFKDLTILLVPEESTRVAMVRTGEAAIASIGPETMLGASRAGLEVLSVPGTMQAVFQFWGTYKPEVKDSPIAKPRVRQALSLAIDRKQVIEHVMNGKARMPYPFATFGYTDYFSADRWEKWAAEAYRYDPALAKKILAEEGYPNGFELKFANTALPGTQFMVDIGTAIADMWTKIGVKVTLKHYEWGSFAPMERGDQAGLVGWASMYRTAGRPDAPWRYDGAFSPESIQRLLGDKDNCHEACQEFVKTYRALLAELDQTKRTALTDHMVEMVANSWTVVPIIEGMGYYAINTKKVGQFDADPRPARAGRRVRAHPAPGGEALEEVRRPRRRAMKRYIARRLMQGVVLLCMVATIVFFLGRLTGNPVDLMLPEDATAEDRAALTQTLGLDGPLLEQFAIFVGKALHGDLGTSIRMKQPAVEAFFDRLPNTLVLIPWALLLGMMLGIPLGVVAALNRGGMLDRAAGTVAVLGVAMPSFWLGILLIFVFSVELGWLPSGRMGGPGALRPAGHHARHVPGGGLHAHHALGHARGDGERVRQARAHQGAERRRGDLEALPAQRADPGADPVGRVRRQPDHRRDRHRDGVRLARHRPADLRGGDLPRLPAAAGGDHPEIDPHPVDQPRRRHPLRLCRSAHQAGLTCS